MGITQRDVREIDAVALRHRSFAKYPWDAAWASAGVSPAPATGPEARAAVTALTPYTGGKVRDNTDAECAHGDRSFDKPFACVEVNSIGLWYPAAGVDGYCTPTDNTTTNASDWAAWTQKGSTIVDLSNPVWTIPAFSNVIVSIPMIPLAATERGLGFALGFIAAFSDPSCFIQADLESNAGHHLIGTVDYLGGAMEVDYNGGTLLTSAAPAVPGMMQLAGYGNVEGPIGIGVRSNPTFGPYNESSRIDSPSFAGGGPWGECRITVQNGGATPMTVEWLYAAFGNVYTGPHIP